MKRLRNSTKRLMRLIKIHDGRCFYCDKGMSLPGSIWPYHTNATREHLKPKSHGGRDVGPNIVAACNGCNTARGTIPWWEFLQIMRSRPDALERTRCNRVVYFWPVFRTKTPLPLRPDYEKEVSLSVHAFMSTPVQEHWVTETEAS